MEIVLYDELQSAYDFYNKELFNNELQHCIITLQRSLKYYGYFFPNRFVHSSDNQLFTCEIALNPEHFSLRPVEKTLSTLVHEMCHEKTFYDKQDSRNAYHNKYWAQCMKDCGLMPSDTGLPGGREVGYKVTHYIVENGPFTQASEKLFKSGYSITWYDRYLADRLIDHIRAEHPDENNHTDIPTILNENKEAMPFERLGRSGVRVKYRCSCSSVWGRPELNLHCNLCNENMIPV